LAAILAGLLWSQRGDLADHFVSTTLHDKGIAATWHIASIGFGEQVITDVVVGDPAHPDLTIDRLVSSTGLHGAAPGVNLVTLINPRLHGSWRGGRLSFGSLDKLLNGPATAPFRLPDLNLRVENGRGEITGDFGTHGAGVVGVGLAGGGNLRDGFAGALVAVAPHLGVAGCALDGARLQGRLTLAGERPRLSGPLQLAGLVCPGAGLRLGAATMPLDLQGDQTLDGGQGHVGLDARGLAAGFGQADSVRGAADFALRRAGLTARYTANFGGVRSPQLTAAALGGEGMLRSDRALSHFAAEGTLSGAGFALGRAGQSGLARARIASTGTLAEPLLARLVQTLAREAPGSRFTARYVLRHGGGVTSLVLPAAQLTGGSGAALLAVSRVALNSNGAGPLQLTGDFVTGGQLPLVAGQMRGDNQRARISLSMADYSAGTSHVALPRLDVAPGGAGGLRLTGLALLSGPLPGGAARNLRLPIAGTWSGGRGLSLWPGCTRLDFDELSFGNLALRRDGLTLCPRPGGAILQAGPRGIALAAGASSFDLAGQFGGSPIHLAGGPVGLALQPGQPGTLVGRAIDVTLGAKGNGGQDGTSRFRVSALTARLGRDVAGSFAGSDIALAAVPLDLRGAGGDWRYAGRALAISGAAFQLEDRTRPARFQPMVARGADLTLAGGVIAANAVLREPHSDTEVARVTIRHDLASGKGHADLAINGVHFGKALQPEALSALTLGVIANAQGTVTGTGAIDWTGDKVTSRGEFSTSSLDFAAAFGPVKGVSGTVVFTDLLGMVTAPDQHLKIAAINPGIEVDDGVLTFALRPGYDLVVKGAEWPFLDGKLELLPTRMTLGASEVRRFEMRVTGIDAAKFLNRMNLSNLSATGLFDGTVPLVFDADGGKVIGGMLTARAPGGNVSYVGALSYKDLSPMANFAFATLRSLNYKQLSIGLDGSLAGDIFTRVTMRGVTQGPGAKRNFLTRQIAKLPLQFNINIRAPFFMLITNFKSIYDSSYLADPRMLGLLGPDGKPLPLPKPAPITLPAPSSAPALTPAARRIQPPVSEIKP
jgi:hypothetical protein